MGFIVLVICFVSLFLHLCACVRVSFVAYLNIRGKQGKVERVMVFAKSAIVILWFIIEMLLCIYSLIAI